MRRSYFKVTKYEDLFLPQIKEPEALIVSLDFASKMFLENNTFDDLFSESVKIFIEIEEEDLNPLLKVSKDIDYSIIAGFYLTGPSKSVLRRLSVASRAIEARAGMYYKTLKFFVETKDAEALPIYVKHNRVDYLTLTDASAERQKVAQTLCREYRRVYIKPTTITSDFTELSHIHEQNKPTPRQVQESLDAVIFFKGASKKAQKENLKHTSLKDHYQVLKTAKRAGMIPEYPIVYFLRTKKKEKIVSHPIEIKKFYTLGEDIANAISHGVGIVLAIVALILLIIKGGSTVEVLSAVVFALSALTLYTASTLYHSFRLGRKTKALFQKLDHISIYLLIAGTYTPFSLVLIGGKTGLGIFIFLWSASLIGLLLNVFAFGKYRFFHMALYVMLGWVAIFFMPQITTALSKEGVVLLILGGVMYTVGIVFYGLKLFKFTHMVWHLFTILGTLFHFLTIYLYL